MAAEESDDADSLRTSVLSISSNPSIASTSDLTLPSMASTSDLTMFDDQPPPYSEVVNDQTPSWTSRDPRSSSQQSLTPPAPQMTDTRRKLLLVYIHGWMGDETSFKSFPAHVFNLVTILLANTHIVYSKIYPRYLAKKQIQVAANDFSNWLAPHESSDTDVILLGHSMGGVLAAEVALLRPLEDEGMLSVDSALRRTRGDTPMRHRIIGTVSFDVPFLGIHPGVVKSGLKGIFAPAPAAPTSEPPTDIPPSHSRTYTLRADHPDNDPRYNPAFPNDTHRIARKPLQNAIHFFNKHADEIFDSTVQLVKSHAEFGGAMLDLQGLKLRYCKIRMLEEDDVNKRRTVVESVRPPPRIRFVNYYTASTGKHKRSANLPGPQPGSDPAPNFIVDEKLPVEEPYDDEEEDLIEEIEATNSEFSAPALSTRSSTTFSLPDPVPPGRQPLPTQFNTKIAYAYALKDYRKEVKTYMRDLHNYRKIAFQGMKGGCPSEPSDIRQEAKKAWEQKRSEWKAWIERTKEERMALREAVKEQHTSKAEADTKRLETLNEMDKESRKAFLEAEKETEKSKREAEKEERKRLEETFKETRKKEQEQRKAERKIEREERRNMSKSEKSVRKQERKERRQGSTTSDSVSRTDSMQSHESYFYNSKSRDDQARLATPHSDDKASRNGKDPAIKDRKFCVLPPKDASGSRDSTWVRVFMGTMDETTAHCAIFLAKQAYETQIGPDAWSERYANLVGDVAERIEAWVLESETVRLAESMFAMEMQSTGPAAAAELETASTSFVGR